MKAVGEEFGIQREIDRIFARIKPRDPTPEELEAERQRQEEARIKELQRIAIPRRFWSASFESGDPSPALGRAKKFIETEASKGHCLVLAGPTGVGKTYAAVAALQAWGGRSKRLFYFPALCGALLDSDRRSGMLNEAKFTQFVVLDDLGTEYLKNGGLLDALVDEIIWHREAEMLATIITTNLMAEQMKERLSERIVDRLRGNWGRVYAVPGESRRCEEGKGTE